MKNRGDCLAIQRCDKNAIVEHDLQNRTLFDEFLQVARVLEQGWRNLSSNFLQRLQTLIQLGVDLRGSQGDRCKLLFAQLALHVLAQHTAGVKGQ